MEASLQARQPPMYPSHRAHNALLYALSVRARQHKRVLSLLKQWQQRPAPHNFSPSHATFALILKGLAKLEDVVGLEQWLEQAREALGGLTADLINIALWASPRQSNRISEQTGPHQLLSAYSLFTKHLVVPNDVSLEILARRFAFNTKELFSRSSKLTPEQSLAEVDLQFADITMIQAEASKHKIKHTPRSYEYLLTGLTSLCGCLTPEHNNTNTFKGLQRTAFGLAKEMNNTGVPFTTATMKALRVLRVPSEPRVMVRTRGATETSEQTK